MHIIDSFKNYLQRLGYSEDDISAGLSDDGVVFKYGVDEDGKLSAKYILTPRQEDVLETHRVLWNRNQDHVFIAVADQHTYVINAKEKPNPSRLLKAPICLKSFDYGVNTIGYEQVKPSEITKDYVDSSFFFDFVSKNLKNRNEVDKDLLLNLLALKHALIDDNNGEFVHLLILRCLFVKYLEDRGIFDKGYLTSILQAQSPQSLLAAFDEIRKINGDVFKYDEFNAGDIRGEYLTHLALFFDSDYRSGQKSLFPYRFDQIPIQLISHVYEAFLKGSSKRRRGIYYTPPFLVSFMLSQVFDAKDAPFIQRAKCLDPAVGSGAFLVESFRAIQKSYGRTLNFDEKKKILEEQLFGIDVDQRALQIAAFSLYLALLETEDPAFIKHEIQHAHPILPSLIGKTLIHGNAITDDIFSNQHFHFIVSNPPWGSVPNESTDMDDAEKREITKERAALDNKSKGYPEYCNVSDYERSQAFLMRFAKWMGDDTDIVAVVKNSIFLNDNADGFRQDLLAQYQLHRFYELSHYNKILFKKKVIGKIGGQQIELGASEPCAVLVLSALKDKELDVAYISPKLSGFAEKFEIINYSDADVFPVRQSALSADDLYWRVLVNGDLEDFDLIGKTLKNKDISIEARAGFQPKKDMARLGEPILKKIIEPLHFKQFDNIDVASLPVFNWNQKLHRKREEDIFKGSRVIIPVRPLKTDNFLFRGVYVEDEVVHKHNILSVKLRDNGKYIDDYLPYLAIFNSELIGFVFFHLSIQWGKGEGKRDTLRNLDVEALPIKRIDNEDTKLRLRNLVLAIQQCKARGEDTGREISELNDTVFNHYGLLDYEKEIIKEFYQKRVDRADRDLHMVNVTDIGRYFDAFKEAFSLILAANKTLNATFHISPNIGAVISISIVDKAEEATIKPNSDIHVLNFVKKGQLEKSKAMKLLREEKVKLYEKDRFFIIKSNRFKDWTVRQAIMDAREEIGKFIQHLSN